jgi:hypothetical protein
MRGLSSRARESEHSLLGVAFYPPGGTPRLYGRRDARRYIRAEIDGFSGMSDSSMNQWMTLLRKRDKRGLHPV